MARKVIREDVQVPTDKWSGLHLSKSVDFTALTKNDVSCFLLFRVFFDFLVADVCGIIVRLYPHGTMKNIPRYSGNRMILRPLEF